jgi:hypothetical protein
MSNQNQNPKPDEKVCYNCKNLASLIGVGQGLICGANYGFRIPSRWHTCEKFESKRIINKNE